MRYMKLAGILGIALLLQVSVYAGIAEKVPSSQQKMVDQTDIRTIDGEVIHVVRTKNGLRFQGYEDKIVLLEAFGYRCPPCKASIPGYNRLQQRYRKDVVIIAVEAWGANNKVFKQFVQTHKIGYKAVSTGDSGKILSFMGKLTGWHPGLGVPYLLLFDRGGILAKDVPPQMLPEAHVEHLIKELLNAK